MRQKRAQLLHPVKDFRKYISKHENILKNVQ